MGIVRTLISLVYGMHPGTTFKETVHLGLNMSRATVLERDLCEDRPVIIWGEPYLFDYFIIAGATEISSLYSYGNAIHNFDENNYTATILFGLVGLGLKLLPFLKIEYLSREYRTKISELEKRLIEMELGR